MTAISSDLPKVVEALEKIDNFSKVADQLGQTPGAAPVCESKDFCIDENGEIIMNGMNVNEAFGPPPLDPVSQAKGNFYNVPANFFIKYLLYLDKRSRMDVTNLIKGAKVGFICQKVQIAS